MDAKAQAKYETRARIIKAMAHPTRLFIVDELAKDYTGKIKVGKMDVDSNSATPMRYGVRGIPTLLVFKGGQVKEQIVGYVPKETIQKAIDKHV